MNKFKASIKTDPGLLGNINNKRKRKAHMTSKPSFWETNYYKD